MKAKHIRVFMALILILTVILLFIIPNEDHVMKIISISILLLIIPSFLIDYLSAKDIRKITIIIFIILFPFYMNLLSDPSIRYYNHAKIYCNGSILKQYHGKIRMIHYTKNYIRFEFNGKDYIYYNCSIELSK